MSEVYSLTLTDVGMVLLKVLRTRLSVYHYYHTYRGDAIMLVKLSIILFSNSHNFATDFTYYSQNYACFNAHGISDS